MDLEKIAQQIARREEILHRGIGLADLDEYNVLTLKLATAAPTMLRALKDVIAFRNELLAYDSAIAPVTRGFASEIDRALKGQRNKEESK